MADQEYEFWKDPIRENPQYRKWTWKVGKIQEIMSTPCNPSYEIWFYAFWHDLPKLVFSLTKPDTVDTYLTRFGAGHKKNRKKRFIVTDALDPSNPVTKGAFGWAMFRLQNMAQRVGWYMMVIDATSDFFINWTSTAFRWDGCDDLATAYASTVSNGIAFNVFPGVYEGFPGWVPATGNTFVIDAGTADTPPGYDVSVGCSLHVTNGGSVSLPLPPFTAELVDYENNIIYEKATPSIQPDGSAHLSLKMRDWAEIKPRHSFGVRINCQGVGAMAFENSVFWVYGNEFNGLLEDP